MKIEILKSTVGDRRNLKAGTTEDVSKETARILILLKKAKLPDGQAEIVDEPTEKEKPHVRIKRRK